jgi:hypothetical protein
MAIKYLDTFTCYFINSNTEKQFPSKEEAMEAARNYCGNNSYSKLFPNEETYIFGPGDGTTSVMVRQDVEFTAIKKPDGSAIQG